MNRWFNVAISHCGLMRMCLLTGSTGLKVYGDGEWKPRKHGVSKRRTWRNLHVGIDPATVEITAQELNGNDVHDADVMEEMLDLEDHIGRFYGDGAYDQRKSTTSWNTKPAK